MRCGKQRIVVKTWQEYSGNSLVTYTTTTCPDAACQKIIDRQLASQKEKRETMERDREERRALAKSTAEANKLVKKT